MPVPAYVPQGLLRETRTDLDPPKAKGGAIKDGAVAPIFVGFGLGLAAALPGVTAGAGGFRLYDLLIMGTSALGISVNLGRITRGQIRLVDVAFGILLVGQALLEWFNAQDVGHRTRLDVTTRLCFYFATMLCVRLSIRDPVDLRRFLIALVLPASPNALLGVLQQADLLGAQSIIVSLTDSASAISRIDEGAYTRATGLIGHWTGFGAYLLVMLVCTLLLISLVTSRTARLLLVAQIALIAAGLISTLTLAVIISGAILLIFPLITRERARLAVGSLIVLLLLAPAVIGTLADRLYDQYSNPTSFSSASGILPETLVYRIQVWTTQLVPTVAERPWTGWGQGFYTEFGEWSRWPNAVTWSSAESQWFFLLVTFGWIGVFLFGLVLVGVYREWVRPHAQRRLLSAAIVLFLGISLTVPIFTNVGLPLPLFALTGALPALYRQEGPKRAARQAATTSS